MCFMVLLQLPGVRSTRPSIQVVTCPMKEGLAIHVQQLAAPRLVGLLAMRSATPTRYGGSCSAVAAATLVGYAVAPRLFLALSLPFCVDITWSSTCACTCMYIYMILMAGVHELTAGRKGYTSISIPFVASSYMIHKTNLWDIINLVYLFWNQLVAGSRFEANVYLSEFSVKRRCLEKSFGNKL